MCTPIIHERFGLNCPCYTKKQFTYGIKESEKLTAVPMNQNLTPRDKYMIDQINNTVITIPFSEDAFIRDWKDWIRHSWNISNFYGSQPLLISGKNISGFSISFKYVNRSPHLVTDSKGLVVQGSNASKLIIGFSQPMTVQFAVLALNNRITVTADDKYPDKSNFILGDHVKFNGKEFAGSPKIQEHEGLADLLFKFQNVQNVSITFNEKIVISDILYK